MTEEQIKNLLKKEYILDLDNELRIIYPNGFDINKIDKRIKNKIIELSKKGDSIQKPVDPRKKED